MLRRLSNLLGYAGFAPFVAIGIGRAVRWRDPASLLLAAFLIYFVGLHALLASEIRYRTSAMPVWFVLGASGLTQIWRPREKLSSRNPVPIHGTL